MRPDIATPREMTVTAQEYNREPSKVKAKAKDGPVVITDRGVPSHVLLTMEEYERLRPPERGLATTLREGWIAILKEAHGENWRDYDDDYDLDPGSDYWASVDESGDFPDLSER